VPHMLLQICALLLGAMDEKFFTRSKSVQCSGWFKNQSCDRAMVIIHGIKYHIESYSHYEWRLLQVRFERCAYTTYSI
jgi:hypothetical protein